MAPILYTLYGFSTFFFIFWCGKWLVHIAAIIYGRYTLHRRVNIQPTETPLPGVSIIKPLMGIDPNLYSNLETFFTMNYPLYEIVFCIEDENDPAIMVVKRLIEKYPSVDSSIFIGGADVGVNPKINNMQPGYLASKYPLILISDSGIKMKEDSLANMVQLMTDDVGLVHQLPFTHDRVGFAATVEKIYFGTLVARIYLVADLLCINCHTGMSALMRKSLINEVGGIEAFSCYLAEDFFFAKSFSDRGWKIRVASYPALQNSGLCEIESFQARLQRWTKLRVAMLPFTIFLEPLSECVVLGTCAAWSVGYLLDWDPLVFFLIHVLLWFIFDWIMLSIVQNGSLPFNKFDFVIGWLFREISGPYLFLNAIWHPTITWRSRTYRLQWGGVAEECHPKVKM